jgi:hypothetical protein
MIASLPITHASEKLTSGYEMQSRIYETIKGIIYEY